MPIEAPRRRTPQPPEPPTQGVVIEITDTTRPTPAAEYTAKLAALGHIPGTAATTTATVAVAVPPYAVAVNGSRLPVPVMAYEVLPGEAGPTVVLSIPADQVIIGGKPAAPPTPQGRATRSWGGADRPDPRAGIPGWQSGRADVEVPRG